MILIARKHMIKSDVKITSSLYVKNGYTQHANTRICFFVQVILKIAGMYIIYIYIYFFSMVMTNVPSFEMQTI